MYVVGQSSHGQVAAAVGGDHAWGPTGRLPCDERPTRIGTGARTSVLQKSPAAGYQIPRCRWRTLRGEQEAVEPIDDARHACVLVALFLLTGCRLREITGLELDDVSFDRRTITIRPNRWRRLKTRTSHRVIPLWPQLEAILPAWVFGPGLSGAAPCWCRLGRRAGTSGGSRTSPSSSTAGRGLRRVYSHLGEVRHRSDVVEFRLEQHLERLGDRLQRLALRGRFVTGNVTVGEPAAERESPAPTEVEAGEAFPESGRPDSNRRRPAWEAGILPLNYARERPEM